MEKVIVTNGDIKEDYEILGVIYCEPEPVMWGDIPWEDTFDEGIKEMKKKCLKMGGNAIIHFTENSEKNNFRFYGTAIKIKNNCESE